MSADINFEINGIILNFRACGLIINDKKVLFQKRQQDEYWALPGGKVSLLEKGEIAVLRELKEEIEVENLQVERLLDVSENFFEVNGKSYHQIVFLYLVHVNQNEMITKINSFDGREKGKNLIFQWIPIEKLNCQPLKPDFLGEQLKKLLGTSEKKKSLIL
jgi:ADP-ribose pyrophosphatase YjhB (NUDIX family)